jgi:HAMP domain-containing protein
MAGAILVVALVPLALLGFLVLRGYTRASEGAIEESTVALNAKSFEALELRAVETAEGIASFLQEREADLRSLVLLPTTEEAYRRFLAVHRSTLWRVREGQEVREPVPLYLEAAYLDTTGREVVAVRHGLPDIPEGPGNDAATYFTRTLELPRGEFYLSHVTGEYVNRTEFEGGQRFEGVLRLAMPHYDGAGTVQGVVTLVLDARHLQEFTAHIVPTEERFTAASDARSGNYAYVIDDRGYVIAHPSDDHIVGLDEEGALIPFATKEEEIGFRPLRLDELGFHNGNLVEIQRAASQGQAGSLPYNWQGNNKIVAYAPIRYTGGGYREPAGFGWVGIGAEVHKFHESAHLVGQAIDAETVQVTRGLIALLLLTAAGVFLIATLLARNLTHPLRELTAAAQSLEEGQLSEERIAALRVTPGHDEVARLSRVFASMATEVQARARRLGEEVERLRIQIDEVKRRKRVSEITETDYFRDLKAKAKEMRRRQG